MLWLVVSFGLIEAQTVSFDPAKTSPSELFSLGRFIARATLPTTMATEWFALGNLATSSHERISAARIRAAAAVAKQRNRDVWLSDDCGYRGLGRLVIRIRANGLCRFYFRADFGEGRKVIPLGPYSRTRKSGFLTIEQARAHAVAYTASLCGAQQRAGESANIERVVRRDSKAPSGAGSLPPQSRTQLQEQNQHAAGTQRASLHKLCSLYVESLRQRRKSSANSIERFLRANVYSHPLAEQPAASLGQSDFVGLLRDIARSSTEYTAEKVRSILHAAYNDALGAKGNYKAVQIEYGFDSNPLRNVKKDKLASRPRERCLQLAEREALWRRLNPSSLEELTYPMRVLRLNILLAGQRGKQLVAVKLASDVDIASRTICLWDPKGLRETPREHLLPLAPHALEEVKYFAERAREMKSPYLFPGQSRGSTLSRDTLSKLVTEISRDMVAAGELSAPFQFIDIRRTTETALAELQVPPHIRAQLLSHGLGGVQDRHYDRHRYMPEKRAALALWEDYLDWLLAGQPGVFAVRWAGA